jgi:DNA-binding IclR family transcriptional regulator
MAFEPADSLQILLSAGLKPLTPYTIIDPRRLQRELATVRLVGSAIESEEAVLGNACVAAPIFDSAGRPVAAVSISGPPMRLRPAQRAPVVRRTAAMITQRIDGQLPEGWR